LSDDHEDGRILMDKLELITRAMGVFDGFDAPSSDLNWRVDGEYAPVSLHCNVNDVFAWGCADAEDIDENSIGDLERARTDLLEADGRMGGLVTSMLYAARKREMRPQGAMYQHIPEGVRHLFDECGPERETGFGNPESQHDH